MVKTCIPQSTWIDTENPYVLTYDTNMYVNHVGRVEGQDLIIQHPCLSSRNAVAKGAGLERDDCIKIIINRDRQWTEWSHLK